MAKNEGVISFTGTVGNITALKRNGVVYIQKKGGVTKERIETDPKFVRTRENMNEFKGVTTISKAFVSGLGGLKRILSDNRLYNRVVKAMKAVQTDDTSGRRGERAILVSTYGSDDLLGFELHRENDFDGLFGGRYSVSAPATGKGATVTVQPFNGADALRAPKGATHARLVVGVQLLSNYTYDDLTRSWNPQNENGGVAGVETSDYLPVGEEQSQSLTLSVTLPGVTDTDGGSVVVILGVEFFQELDGSYYLLHDTNGGKVVALL